VLLTVAVDVHFRIEPTRVVEGPSLNKSYPRHGGNIRKDWRPALWTKVPLNRLTTIASVVECLKLPVPVVNQIRTFWWCKPPKIGRQRMHQRSE
jgi:hypothetical protein